MTWHFKTFSQLSLEELYAILRLRNEIFIVEQNCPYQDLDNKDQRCWHLAGWEENELVAYTRILPPGVSYPEASIGRVLTAAGQRGNGTGRKLMELSIEKTFEQFQYSSIRIGAQVYLQKFYESLGFSATGAAYLEDNIPHVEMLLKK
jgi:ElaA protein